MALQSTFVTDEQIASWNEEFRDQEAETLLAWGYKTFGSKIMQACGLGAEGLVLLDMGVRINPAVRIFTIDTGRLFKEAYDLIDRCEKKYGITFERYSPKAEDIDRMTSCHGVDLFYKSIPLRNLCCEIRKTWPLKRALSGAKAWITGLREDHTTKTRTALNKIDLDLSHGGIIKINPLTDWSEKRVWDYMAKNHVPYNPLYDQGYRSIGCQPCTTPIQPGESVRAGRWRWEHSSSEKECGLHTIAPLSVEKASSP
jgi:thioredoxin-dependent adenylylsulfate APS reductase